MRPHDRISTLLVAASWLALVVAGVAVGLVVARVAEVVLGLALAGYALGLFLSLRLSAWWWIAQARR